MRALVFSREKQAFYLSIVIFAPILMLIIMLNSTAKTAQLNSDFTLNIAQISVATSHKPQTSPPAPTPAKPIKKRSRHAKTAHKPAQKAFSQTSPSPTPQASNAQNAASNEPQTTVFGRSNDPILAAIKSAIDKHAKYPLKARKMRASGEVWVEFIYDGRLKDLKIIKSSSHAILDDAAINAIKNSVATFPKIDKAYRISVPIIYNLA